MAETPNRSRRPRRRFDDDFKAQAVRLMLDEGKRVGGAVARDLDLTETALREWVHRARADRTHGRWTYAGIMCCLLLDSTEDAVELFCEQIVPRHHRLWRPGNMPRTTGPS